MTGAPGRREHDRGAIEAVYAADRAVHVYGLADLDEPFWSRSRWWRDGTAVIGDIGVGDPTDGGAADAVEGIVYGIAAHDPGPTLDLWVEVDGQLPDRYLLTGPAGTVERLAAAGRSIVADFGEYVKMVLTTPERVRGGDGEGLRPLGRDDLPLVEDLRRRAPDPAAFFEASLLDVGPHAGVLLGGRLVAMAGVHVCSDDAGVAAIGNVLVDPAHRGRGLGRRVTAAVVDALRQRPIATIGLNVAAANTSARRIYTDLGFEVVHRYTEALVERPA